MQRDVTLGYLVVTTCKGMSLCGKEGDMVVHAKGCHMVVTKGMSLCGKEGHRS